MADETVNTNPGQSRTSMRVGWAAAIAGMVFAACLCGFAAGSILISAGVSAYSGWSGVAVTRLVVTVAFVNGPTYTPLPTYTLQPTYTPLPTNAPQPAYTIAPTAPVSTQEAPTLAVPPTSAAGVPARSSEDIVYEVMEGDTLETVAEQFGADIVPIIVANSLDPNNPDIQPGDSITIPFNISSLCVPDLDPEQGEVVGVFNGDTIEVAIGGQNNTVRYIGIDAPDPEPDPEPFAAEAQTENQTLVNGLTVSLVEDAQQMDDASRQLRYVIIGDTFVNYDLVRRGFAQAAPTPPNSNCDELFALAEEQARTEGLGMWAQEIAPSGQDTPYPGVTLPVENTPNPSSTQPSGATPYQTPASAAWSPPPSSTPTATSSLGYNCQCRVGYVWGNFQNLAQANACAGICAIAATRQAAQEFCVFDNGEYWGCATP